MVIIVRDKLYVISHTHVGHSKPFLYTHAVTPDPSSSQLCIKIEQCTFETKGQSHIDHLMNAFVSHAFSGHAYGLTNFKLLCMHLQQYQHQQQLQCMYICMYVRIIGLL